MFLVSALVNSCGMGMFMAVSMIHYTVGLGLPMTQVGVVMSVSVGVSLVCVVPVSSLADRVGPLTALIALNAWQACAFVILMGVDGILGLAVVATMTAVGGRAIPPINQAVVAVVLGHEERVLVMARVRAARNAGMAVGSGMTALALAFLGEGGAVLLIGTCAFTYLVNCAGLWWIRRSHDVSATRGRKRKAPPAFRDSRYLTLTALNGLLAFHMTGLVVALPLWALSQGVEPEITALFLGLNTVLVVGLQVRLGRGVEGVPRAASAVVWAAAALSCSYLLFGGAAWTSSWWTAVLLCVGVVLLSVGEIGQTTSAWVVSYDLAPEDARSSYLATFSLGTTGQQLLGPLAYTFLIIPLGFWAWVVLAATTLAAAFAYRSLALRTARRKNIQNPDPNQAKG